MSEIVVRPDDNIEDLERKARIATIIGTLQATLTDFRYLRPIWKRNTEEEALLGVSMTGIMDHPTLNGSKDVTHLPKMLTRLKNVTIETNIEWANKLGINQSTAITCVKPSGTVSQLVDSASGIHSRHAPFYIRRVRADVKDPLAIFMRDNGFPCEVDVINSSNYVFSFPVKSPEGAICTMDRTGMEQLELWRIYQDYWCEHKPSITVSYKDSEFLAIGQWMYNNFDSVSGVSFLPYSDHTYQQAPYEEISEEEYEAMQSLMPKDVDFSKLAEYEQEDNTVGSQELACVGTSCEI